MIEYLAGRLPLTVNGEAGSVGYVYVVQPPKAGWMKIGWTTNPEKRIRALKRQWIISGAWGRAGCKAHDPVVVLALFCGSKELEQRLFSEFSDLRLPLVKGETGMSEYFAFRKRAKDRIKVLASIFGLPTTHTAHPLVKKVRKTPENRISSRRASPICIAAN